MGQGFTCLSLDVFANWGRRLFILFLLRLSGFCVWWLFAETTTTDRSLHDRRADKLCSHHTRRLWRHGHGLAIGGFIFVATFVYEKYKCVHFSKLSGSRVEQIPVRSGLQLKWNQTISVVDDYSFLGGPCSGPDEIKRWLRTRRVWRLPVVTVSAALCSLD